MTSCDSPITLVDFTNEETEAYGTQITSPRVKQLASDWTGFWAQAWLTPLGNRPSYLKYNMIFEFVSELF